MDVHAQLHYDIMCQNILDKLHQPLVALRTHNRPQCQGVQLVHSGSTKKTLGHQRVGIRQMAIMYPHRYEFPDAADLGNLETLADLLNEKEQDFERDAHHAAILVSLLQE